MTRRWHFGIFVGAAGLLVVASAAFASDGVIEINQTSVLVGGITSGDTAGFPVTLSQPGSYALTGNLTVPDAGTTAIRVEADRVTIDLHGFGIFGPTTCSSSPPGCTPGGASGGGIVGAFANGVSVHDGFVEGMGANGIELGNEARVERVFARFNGAFGIDVGTGSVVLANRVTYNGNGGMLIGRRSAYADNVIFGDGLGPSVTFAFGVATATGGNVCDDKLCSGRGERRYYLTKNLLHGNQALTACTPGYHMASEAEIHDTASLVYDTALGQYSSSFDQGDGPPKLSGWGRSGDAFSDFAESCTNWTTTSGTGIALTRNVLNADRWVVAEVSCNLSIPVWCIQD